MKYQSHSRFLTTRYFDSGDNYPSYTTLGDIAVNALSDTALFYYDSNFTGSTFFYETYMESDGTRTFYTALFNQSGTQLSGSELSTTSSSRTRVRSSSLALSSGDTYHQRVKTSSTLTDAASLTNSKLIWDTDKNDSGPAITSVIDIWSSNYWIYGVTPQVLITDYYVGDIFYYDSTNWIGDWSFYFEATLSSRDSGYTAEAILHNYDDSSSVTSGGVSTTSTTTVRARTSALTLTTDKNYCLSATSDGVSEATAGNFNTGRVVAVSSNPIKWETHIRCGTSRSNMTNTSYWYTLDFGTLWESSKWENVDSIYFEAVLLSNPDASPATIYAGLYNETTTFGVSNSFVSDDTGVVVRKRTSDIKSDLPTTDTDVIFSQWKISGSTTGTGFQFINGGKLVVVVEAFPNRYSKDSLASLPVDESELSDVYSYNETLNIEDDDSVYTSETGLTSEYVIHKYSFSETSNTAEIDVSWNGQTDTETSSRTVYLQIWDDNGSTWETVDSDSTTSADTDFSLSGSITTNLSNYYIADGSNKYWVHVRVYQDV